MLTAVMKHLDESGFGHVPREDVARALREFDGLWRQLSRREQEQLIKTMVETVSYDGQIRRGIATDYTDLARLGCISKERVSQIMRLVWLAPDVQQEILTLPRTPRGRFPVGEPALRQIASRMLWSDQRAAWERLSNGQPFPCYSPPVK